MEVGKEKERDRDRETDRQRDLMVRAPSPGAAGGGGGGGAGGVDRVGKGGVLVSVCECVHSIFCVRNTRRCW